MLKFMLGRFARDRHATIALITAIAILPLLLFAVGVPIDLARAIQYRATLQNVADAAALAGSEALGVGANPAQACAVTLAYVDVPVANGELPATATPAATLTSPGLAPGVAGNKPSVFICNTASAVSTPQTTTATAPDSVDVTISGSQPMTFLSIYKPKTPVTVSSTVIGPQGFITICVLPKPNFSGDLSQAYYYLLNPDGSLTNEAGSAVATSSSGLLPTSDGVVTIGGVKTSSAFLGDDKWPTDNPPPATGNYCDSAKTTVAVQVKTGLAQRLGFAYYVVTNGQGPCTAVYPKLTLNGNLSDFSCLQNGQNYTAYSPYAADTNIYNPDTNVMNFYNYYQTPGEIADDPRTKTKNTPYLLLPNAYGSPVGWVNAFFSTDYPASLNTNNYEAGTNPNVNGGAISPTGGDTCFTTYTAPTKANPISYTIATVSNGYTAASQSCIIQESSSTENKALTAILDKDYQNTAILEPVNAYGKNPQSIVAFWSSWSDPNQLQSIGGTTYPAKTDLVCLVHDGGTNNAAADTTLKITNKGSYSVASGANLTATNGIDQQENLVIASNAPGSNGANVYQCPDDTVGNAYYPDPTCQELNGATLQIGWNDMGGILYDNGNYVDLHYSYSCNPPAAGTIINSAIIQ